MVNDNERKKEWEEGEERERIRAMRIISTLIGFFPSRVTNNSEQKRSRKRMRKNFWRIFMENFRQIILNN